MRYIYCCMDFLINESQLRTILQEQDESRMTEYMKTMYSFTKNLANRVSKVYGLNLKMLLTWGTSVGGLVMPLDQFIKNGNFDLTDDQRYLVLAGIAFVMFFENKKGLVKILETIKEEGLEDAFRTGLDKAKELKSSFKSTSDAASRATSVPRSPIAIPMWAALSAGASLTPSPVIATISPCIFKLSTKVSF